MHIILQASTQGEVNLNLFLFLNQNMLQLMDTNSIDFLSLKLLLTVYLEYAINENVLIKT